MRLIITSIVSLALIAAAHAADAPFAKDDLLVERVAIHGPFNGDRSVIKKPTTINGSLLPPEVREIEGDDLAEAQPVAGTVATAPVRVATTEVGEENAVSARIDPSLLKLPSNSWDVDGSTGLQALDMQIAASHSHLVLSSVHNIAFFTKDGSALDHMSIADFFQFVRQDMNDKVLDPATGKHLAAPYQIDEFYDARVVFDAYRQRFWIGCLARNSEAKYGTEPDHTKHRVTKFALAVSKTEDPRDGFVSYWWDPVHDYPRLGVSEKLVVVGLGGEAVAVVADDLAKGTATKGYDLKNFRHSDGTVAGENLCPAVHHGASAGGAHFVVSSYHGGLSVWGIDQGDPAKLFRAGVPLAAYQAPVPADQRGNSDIPHPHQILMTNVGTLVMKAVYRGGKLYAVWHDARQWGGAAGPVTALRLARVDVSHFPSHVTAAGRIDRTFGKRSAADPPGTIFSYYWPSLEVNRDGTMLLSYNRSGATIYPEIRYSIYRESDADIESSQLFQAGEYPLGKADPNYATRPDAKAVGRLDFTASAVDPQDDRTIWILQPYAVKSSTGSGGYRLRVGRVLISK